MKLSFIQLPQHLKQNLALCYLLSGDDIFQQCKALQLIKDAAKTKGFTHTERITIENANTLHSLLPQWEHCGLFDDKIIFHVEFKSTHLDKAQTECLQTLLSQHNDDRLLIIQSAKLPSAKKNAAWIKCIEQHGVHLPLWPMERAAFKSWLTSQIDSWQMQLSPEAIEQLITLTEGNGLSAEQALMQLRYGASQQPITAETILSIFNDNTQFSVFDLLEAITEQSSEHTHKIVNRLQQQDEPLIKILALIVKELELLLALQAAQESDPTLLMRRLNLWRQKLQQLQRAARRIPSDVLKQALKQAATIDAMLKGAQAGDPWQAFLMMCLALVKKPINLSHVEF